MKSLVIQQLILVSCSLLATNAINGEFTFDATDQQCDKLLSECNQLRDQCSPDMVTLSSCCDLISFPPSKAPTGIYHIMTNCSSGSFTRAVDVYCDMDNSHGGWMVIQRNINDGETTFNKTMKEFEEGFGDLKGGKLWYGLKSIYCFTNTGQWELRIDFQFSDKSWSYLHYSQFSIGNASQQYKLNIGGFTGTTNDPFETPDRQLNGEPFSTVDDDDKDGCANYYHSGWWYNGCYYINLNGQPPSIYLNSAWYNIDVVEMKIRQRDCISQ